MSDAVILVVFLPLAMLLGFVIGAGIALCAIKFFTGKWWV